MHSIRRTSISTATPLQDRVPTTCCLHSDTCATAIRSASSPLNWTDVANDLHDVSFAACTEAKKEQTKGNAIEIYSIAVSTSAGPGTRVHDLLKDCASTPEKFFYAA